MIGCGFVGSASVFALMQSGLFTEITLIDADKNKAEGEAMDISHGIPFASPVDILTQVAIKLSGLPENRVIGSGTVLDSARLRYKLGEHGDSEVVAWSSANVSGVPLSEMCGHYKHKENTAEIATAVKNSTYEIINKKHATYYGIAM